MTSSPDIEALARDPRMTDRHWVLLEHVSREDWPDDEVSPFDTCSGLVTLGLLGGDFDVLDAAGDLTDRGRALLAYVEELAKLPGTFVRSDGRVNCDLCCTGDRCDEPRHRSRRQCRMCTGGALPVGLGRAVLRALEADRG